MSLFLVSPYIFDKDYFGNLADEEHYAYKKFMLGGCYLPGRNIF